MQSQVAKFLAQGLPGDPQQAGGLVLIAVRIFHDTGQEEPVQLAVHFRVQVARIGPEALTDIRLHTQVGSRPAAPPHLYRFSPRGEG